MLSMARDGGVTANSNSKHEVSATNSNSISGADGAFLSSSTANRGSGGQQQHHDAIDTDLYSRQIGTFGFETMGKLIKMKVLICGLNGVGVETGECRD